MKKVFIVCANGKVSQEGYAEPQDAIDFIKARSDKPQQYGAWVFISDSTVYTIKEITIKGAEQKWQ